MVINATIVTDFLKSNCNQEAVNDIPYLVLNAKLQHTFEFIVDEYLRLSTYPFLFLYFPCFLVTTPILDQILSVDNPRANIMNLGTFTTQSYAHLFRGKFHYVPWALFLGNCV